MWDNQNLNQLIAALTSLRSADETKAFLRDLMTEAELKEFARRWRAARMLNDKIPYTTIESETGLSSATIARVSKWLQEGSGGYKIVLDRMPAEIEKETRVGTDANCLAVFPDLPAEEPLDNPIFDE